MGIIDHEQNRVGQLGEGFLEEYVRYASELTDAPEIFHCGCALVLMSSIVGPRAVDLLRKQRANLWMLLLGPSTIYRKTTAMRIARRLLETIDKSVFIAADFSPQGLWDEFADRRNQVSVLFRDEVSGFFSSARQHGYMAGVKAGLIKLFDGDDFSRKLRKELVSVEQPYFVWLGGAVTEKLMESTTEDDIFSGFMIRFILINPESRGPIRPIAYEPDFADESAEDLVRYLEMIQTRLEAKWSFSVGETTVSGSSPCYFRLRPRALAHLVAFTTQLEEEGLGDPIVEKINGRIGPLTTKLMLLFAADHRDHTTRIMNTIFVDEDLILKSIYWARIFQTHLIRTLRGVSQSKRERESDRIVEFVRRNPNVTRGKIMRRFKLTAREMDEVKNTLTERRLIKVSVRVSKTRSAETYSTTMLETLKGG